jgi:methanogenic corrinoid protein MtbC1
MATPERTQQIIKGLFDSVVGMDEKAAVEFSQAALAEGVDAYYAVTEGLAKAMDKVGELYSCKEYFVAELLLASDALYAALSILQPHVKTDSGGIKRKMLLGVVEGDIHDIGKNLVKIMFEAAGWTVIDLGKDVKLTRFAEEQAAARADVIAVSALMTTSMLAIPKVIELVRAKDPDVAIIVGGAPLTREIAERYGADGYSGNAGEAVKEAVRVLEKVQSRKIQKP